MMIVNTSAGSSGARRTQPWRRRSARARTACVPATGGAIAVIMASLRVRWRCVPTRPGPPSRGPVRVADDLCVQLGLRQRGGSRLGAGDGRTELLADVGAEILELGDVQELDAGVRHRLEGRMGRVGRVDRLQGQRAVDGRQLLVLRYLVAGEPAAG